MTLSSTSINLVAGMRRSSPGRSLAQALFPLIFAAGCILLVALEGIRIRSERKEVLYLPRRWASLSMRLETDTAASPVEDHQQNPSLGGGSTGLLPLDVKYYRVKPGDTLSGIAHRFGMDLDTIASLNREWGSGVHLISVGEIIKIPNQDGIFIPLQDSLEALCASKEAPPEAILQVNHLTREEIKPGMELFFPGVQHTGIERSVVTGTAFLRPVRGYISSGFGYRRDPFTKEIKFHRGIDFAVSERTVIRSALDGKVISLGYDSILGTYILIKHQIGYATLYAHLHSTSVRRGAHVRRGQPIGLVGNTGRSTGPHLHFELRKNGIPMNAAGLISGIY